MNSYTLRNNRKLALNDVCACSKGIILGMIPLTKLFVFFVALYEMPTHGCKSWIDSIRLFYFLLGRKRNHKFWFSFQIYFLKKKNLNSFSTRLHFHDGLCDKAFQSNSIFFCVQFNNIKSMSMANRNKIWFNQSQWIYCRRIVYVYNFSISFPLKSISSNTFLLKWNSIVFGWREKKKIVKMKSCHLQIYTPMVMMVVVVVMHVS